MVSNKLLKQYHQLVEDKGFVCLQDRAFVELSGEDRVSFLQNFCTADIKAMQIGESRELFVLDARGKTVGFGHVLCLPDRLLTTMGSRETGLVVRDHLDKYLIRDDVRIVDRSYELCSIFVVENSDGSSLSPPLKLAPHQVVEFVDDGSNIVVANIELAGFGTLIILPKGNLQRQVEMLTDNGIPLSSIEALEMYRLEQGIPWYGAELDNSNLPQELRRDDTSISFTKGCYLGQETVAKIDAFGHVNKFLVGVQISGETKPEPELLITLDDTKIGVLKTVAFSPLLSSWLGLGFVKCKQADPGTEVQIGSAKAKIVQLPLS